MHHPLAKQHLRPSSFGILSSFIIRHSPLLPVLLLSCLPAFAQLPREYTDLKSAAEQSFSEASFARAHETYQKAATLKLPPGEARWVQFRLADTLWRSQAATQTADSTKFDQAHEQLQKLIRDIKREEDRDLVWAEVHESLGDFFWMRRHSNNWGAAWPPYQQALDWWAASSNIPLARERYLQIVWKMSELPGVSHYSYGAWGNFIPIEILDNAVKLAQTDSDKARAHYLIAMTLRQRGQQDQQARVPEEFEAAIELGGKTDWYDDALYHYAQWMTSHGQIRPLENGTWGHNPDYVKAVELFRRLVREFEKGETRYWEQAQQQIRNLTGPQVNVSVANIFLPDSEIQYHLNWRNVERIEFALYAVDLNRDVKLDDRRERTWLQSIEVAPLDKINSWSRETNDKGDHKPGSETIRLDGKLEPGAYLLEAKSGEASGRDLVLVTDSALVLKTSGRQALVFFCNALDSSPMGAGKVKLWERWHENNRWHTREQTKDVGEDGIAVFDLVRREHHSLELFASAVRDDRQAFSTGNSYWHGRPHEPWRIYAFTDRPAYRPNEAVQWKFIARRHNGSVYSTPSEQTIEFEIADPRGTKVKEDRVALNAFGSVWGSLELTEQMPLGEYQVSFWSEGRKEHIGQATLFRLEEYKLPEFKVGVKTPEAGAKKTFRVGDKIEVEIQADYYFGGPVANASVEVVVHQNPFYHHRPKPREFPWFYEDLNGAQSRWGRGYGGGQIIKRETLKTDATGKAILTFDTPRNASQDFEYRIEARVTDASRREITGEGRVRVTRQSYYVYAEPDRHLYRPQDKVRVEFTALDANSQPVQAEGMVKVTRDYWFEIWVAPDGREIKGDELKRLREQGKIWPPPPERPDQREWKLKFRGYEHDEILTRALKTDAEGNADLTFTPERDGYYRIQWSSEDDSPLHRPSTITTSTTVWVASNRTTELGYRTGGVEIILDKDTFRAGQKAAVMLSAPANDRYVLFSVEGEDLYSHQLVHLTGTVKLIELDIEEKHVPNIHLSAALVHDRQFFIDTKQVVVPPTQNFLTVEVKSDREQYQPREEGSFTITTRDHENKPVPAEVAFGVVDESVYYIQQDYAGDPRQFYFGTKRGQHIQTQSTMHQKSYARLVQGEKEQLLDERELLRRRELRAGGGAFDDKAAVGGLALHADVYFRSEIETTSRGTMSGRLAAAPAPARDLAKQERLSLAEMPAMTPPPGEEPAVQVRTDFRSTVSWQPGIITDKDGSATVKLKYPDSLTGWKAVARAASQANQFGIADTTTRTKQPLIVRLQAPRFFVVGDKTMVSGVLNNNTDQDLEVGAFIATEPFLNVMPLHNTNFVVGGRIQASDFVRLKVAANSEIRADWMVSPMVAGEIKIKVSTLGGPFSDAMEKTYLVHEHGIEKFIARSGKVRGDDITVKLDIPKERKPESTSLTVQITPSMAVTMLDALPYLIDYPYGCTEQTMSRFLPAAIVAKTLKDLGLEPEDIAGRIFGGIEQEHAASTQPKGKKDLEKLEDIIKAGLDRLYDFQHGDGGWGWWKDGDSDRWMTAYVVWGLSLARGADIEVKANVLERGAQFLDKTLVEEEAHPDMQSWMLHALAVYADSRKVTEPTKFQQTAFDNLWNKREKLNAYSRALLALSAHHFGSADRAKILIENLENGVKRDDRPDASILIHGKNVQHPTSNIQDPIMGAAHWGQDGIYWRWSEGGVEATAFALRALLAIDPGNKLVEPVTNWLIKNRRGAQWSNTRDTAIVVLAMNDYLRASGELKTELEYELLVNGQSIATKQVDQGNLLSAPSRFEIDPELVREANEIRIRRKRGEGSIYFAADAKFFSLEEPVSAAGNEIFVKREYFKITPRPTLLKGFVFDKVPLKDGDKINSGERVETVITIEGKNHYEYLVFEDLKPAGFEAVQVRSGESLFARELKSGAVPSQMANRQSPMDYTGRSRWVYQELRDRKVALFIDKLPEGYWELRYEMRAEVPGEFHALPVLGHAMYVPEIRCNGEELRITVLDRGL